KAPDEFSKKIQRRTKRKLKSQQRKNDSAWFGLGMFGLVGWSIVVPALLSIGIGLWMDQRWPVGNSWVLTLFIVGIVLGCSNAWYWIDQENDDDD
ncbi:MAG: ATP synthase protein I, partial [Arenicella sp.]